MNIRLLRTAFFTSLFAYVGFLFLEYYEAGIVSNVMSVHVWLIPIGVVGFFLARRDTQSLMSHRPQLIALIPTVLIGLAFGAIVWHNGDVFGDFRVLLALGATALPTVAYYSLVSLK